jgi:hypothetical protein
MSATKRAYDFFLETGRDAFKGELTHEELARIGITPMEVKHHKLTTDTPSEAKFRRIVEMYPDDEPEFYDEFGQQEPNPYDGTYSEE